MEITDELLAAYAEGNVTEPERNAVRQYLTENPEQLETVMMLMDKDSELCLDDGESGEDKASLAESAGVMAGAASLGGVLFSAAAFAPCVMPKMIKKPKPPKLVKGGFNKRLDSLLDELDL